MLLMSLCHLSIEICKEEEIYRTVIFQRKEKLLSNKYLCLAILSFHVTNLTVLRGHSTYLVGGYVIYQSQFFIITLLHYVITLVLHY